MHWEKFFIITKNFFARLNRRWTTFEVRAIHICLLARKYISLINKNILFTVLKLNIFKRFIVN